MKHSNVIELFEALRPFDAVGVEKARFGSSNDGGYILSKNHINGATVFSYGLDYNVSFDMAMANLNCRIHMFDHTISGLAVNHDLFEYHREGIGPIHDPVNLLDTLENHLSKYVKIDESNLILKLDVEGAEWDVLAAVQRETLSRFKQIVVEIHSLSLVGDDVFRQRALVALQKLNEDFILHHVHANNCAPMIFINQHPMADVLELSYIRKDLAVPQANTQFYPTYLDAPNEGSRQDLPLWFYPFIPVAPLTRLEAKRMAAELDIKSSMSNLQWTGVAI